MPSRSRSATIKCHEIDQKHHPTTPSSSQTMPPMNDVHSVLQRLQKLSIPSASRTEHRSPALCTLGPAFTLSESRSFDKAANYAPRPQPACDLSPQSSTSSDSDFSSATSSVAAQDAFEAFIGTQSRVVRLSNLPPASELLEFLCSVFHPQSGLVPATMWMLRGDPSVWAVFPTHREACAALSLSSHRMSVAPALQDDLKHLEPLISEDYSLSSNPPSPRTTFRLGDWICRSTKCAAHNFGRNLTCIGCGCPRSPTANGSAVSGNDIRSAQSPHQQHCALQTPPRPQLSPRFASAPNSMQQYPANLPPGAYGFSSSTYNRVPQQGYAQQAVVNLPPPASSTANISMSAHPLLTPSGRAFASGGRVQNISRDPLSPCIMYWPDNEPFPEQGQIRPNGLSGVAQPPILNTGNRGPISHQPGDWICLKCNYLNWRRRKVCQTCLPYAEGNGDSISAAVQAERIALLTSVLSQTRLTSSVPLYPPIGRSHSTTPAEPHRSFVNFSPPPTQPRMPVHRSQSHNELSSQYSHGYPIYQTAPPHGQHQQRQYFPSPLQHSADAGPSDLYAPTPLLPSFLQDIVQSPTLSPASTSSADLSFEEYEDSLPSSTRSTFSSGADSVNTSPLANIWRLDGEESKSLSGFSFPAHQELTGGAASSRNGSLERLGVHISSS